MNEFDLNRFLTAQDGGYSRALNEIKNAQKRSHWMWYIFPQWNGLGRTIISIKYAIKSREEAIAYFEHPVLGIRLREITKVFLNIDNKSAKDVLGSPDFLKMKSCMTLFHLIQKETDFFNLVLEKFYDGKLCKRTQQKLEKYF